MAEGLTGGDVARRMLDAAAEQGLDLEQALLGDADALRPTDVAQPALLLVECALHELAPMNAVAVAGHSVGEYAACVAAGALQPEDAMRLVVARGRAMAAMREGTMRAFIGIDVESVRDVCDAVQRETGEVVVVANVNAPGQVVVSGSLAGVDAAAQRAGEAGLRRAVPLNVGGAFHSPLMREAAERFAAELDRVPLRAPAVPVVCNVDAEAVRDPDALRQRLRRQLTSPVLWIESVQRLLQLGADLLVEIGPGAVLTGLARRIAPGTAALSVSTPDAARALVAPAARP